MVNSDVSLQYRERGYAFLLIALGDTFLYGQFPTVCATTQDTFLLTNMIRFSENLLKQPCQLQRGKIISKIKCDDIINRKHCMFMKLATLVILMNRDEVQVNHKYPMKFWWAERKMQMALDCLPSLCARALKDLILLAWSILVQSLRNPALVSPTVVLKWGLGSPGLIRLLCTLVQVLYREEEALWEGIHQLQPGGPHNLCTRQGMYIVVYVGFGVWSCLRGGWGVREDLWVLMLTFLCFFFCK